MKHCLAVVICLLVFPILANSTDIDLLAREFFRLNTPEETIKSDFMDQMDWVVPYMGSMMSSELKLNGTDSASGLDAMKDLFGFLVEELDYQALEQISAQIIGSQYSAEELIAVNAFLKTPAGAAYVRNSRPASSYLSQAVKLYFEEKSKDENWLMGMVFSLFAKMGLEGLMNPDAGSDNDAGMFSEGYWDKLFGDFTMQPDSSFYGDENWGELAYPDTTGWYDWDESAYADSVSYEGDYGDWGDYWGGPAPIVITMSGKFSASIDEIAYLFGEVLPVCGQVYNWLNGYVEEHGEYPDDLDWNLITPVKGYDLDYDPVSILLKANSNSSYVLPGIEIVCYLSDNSVWISIPTGE